MKKSTLQREYDGVCGVDGVTAWNCQHSRNYFHKGSEEQKRLKMRVIHFVTVITLMMKSKLPPRAARGTFGSLKKTPKTSQHE